MPGSFRCMVIYKSIPNGESPYDSIYYWWWISWFDNSESLFMTPWRKVPGEKKHHEHHFSWAGQLKTIETVLPPSISRKWKMGFSKMGHFNISFILWVTFKIEPCFRRNGNHRFFFHIQSSLQSCRVYHFFLFRMWSVGWKDLKDLNANYVTVPWVHANFGISPNIQCTMGNPRLAFIF